MPDSRIDVASLYAVAGFKVFPAGSNKKPLTAHGFKDASSDIDVVQAWWSKFPGALVGLACEANQLVVLDFDTYKPGCEKLLAEVENQTGVDLTGHPYRVRSPHGGVHVYFRMPEGVTIKNGTNVLGRGADVRAAGGYIIGADGSDYVLIGDDYGCRPGRLRELPELPEALVQLLTAGTTARTTAGPTVRVEPSVDEPRLRSALGTACVGAENRDRWFKYGAAIYDAFGGSEVGFAIWDDWSRTAPDKHDPEEQRHYWNTQFGNATGAERTTVASIYGDALANGWTDEPKPVAIRLAVPSAVPVRGGDLAASTMAALRGSFASRGHRPSKAQWSALEDIAGTLESMANGKLDRLVYLSSVDPGVGKTQTIIHFTRTLMSSPVHTDVGVIICLGCLQEIGNIVDEMDLDDDDFAVMVSDTKENRKLNAMGNPQKGDARVLFTTQQMLESRSKGRRFSDVAEFHYHGRPRQVRIWDEAMLPGRTLCVNVSLIEAMTHVVVRDYPRLHNAIDELIRRARSTEDRGFVDVPNFEQECDVDLNRALGIFGDEKPVIQSAVNDLWLLSGKTVAVRRAGNNNTVLDYDDTLPDDLAPVLVTDASGRVRQTYPHWSQGRGNLVELRHARKDYDNLTVRIWRRGGSKSAWKENWSILLEGIAATIETKPDEQWLVVRHKPSRTVVDVARVLRERLPDAVFRNVRFIHWGDHSASNDYRDIKNVILAGTLFYEPSYYEATGRLSRGMRSDEPLDPDHYRQIEAGEHAHLILQAACRGAVRKSDGAGCCPCDLYVIASPKSGIPSMLEGATIFPNCKVIDWSPVAKNLKGKALEAFEYVVPRLTHDGAEMGIPQVREAIDCDKDNFNKRVLGDPDFEGALAQIGIYLDKKKGRSGSRFVKMGPVDPDTLSPF